VAAIESWKGKFTSMSFIFEPATNVKKKKQKKTKKQKKAQD